MKISVSCFILYLTFLLMLLPGYQAHSQQSTDIRMRLSADVSTAITKKLNAGLEYEHRFDKNLTSFEKAFIEPSLSYDIVKDFRVGASYRLALSQTNSRNQKIQQRSSAYLQYRFRFDDFRVRFRTILQYGFDDLTSTTSGSNRNLINRNSVQVDYSIFGTKLRPFAKYELFYHINDLRGGIINQQRASIGTQYRFSKSSSFSAFYMFENEMNIFRPVNSHIFGLGYSYSF